MKPPAFFPPPNPTRQWQQWNSKQMMAKAFFDERAVKGQAARNEQARAEAERLLASGDPAGALRLLQPLVAQNRNDSSLHFQIGLCALRLNRLPDAEASFRAAVSLASYDPNARYYLGLALERQGRKAEAISSFQSATSLKPDFAQAKAKLAAYGNPSSKAAAPAPRTSVVSTPPASMTAVAPRRGTIAGVVTRLQQRPWNYGRIVLAIVVEPDGGGPVVSVQMRGHLRGAPLEIGHRVELSGKPRNGLLDTKEIRNLTLGGAPVYVVRPWFW
jgi:tetratricopeptide (TPR) repeat protein